MALRECKDCGKKVSTKARACVGCGGPIKPRSSALRGFLAMVLLGAVVLGVVNAAKNGTGNPRHASAKQVQVNNTSGAGRPIPHAEEQAVEHQQMYVIVDRVAERLAPDATATATNHVYKGQTVQVHETRNGWARVSPFYEGAVEGHGGTVARWVRSDALSAERPAAPPALDIAAESRTVGLVRRPGLGLDEYDVLILNAAARYFLESGIATKVVDGDKSVSRDGYYYLNFGKPQNHFFRPTDIPDLDRRIAALRR